MAKLQSRYELVEEITPEGYTEIHYKDRPKNLFELLENTVQRWPHEEAFVDGDQRLTYRQFHEFVDRLSTALQKECDIDKGDRVALLMGIGIPFAIAYFSVIRLGAVVVPLNTKHTGDELSYEINDSEAKALIADNSFYNNNIAPVRDQLKTISHFFVNGEEPAPGAKPFSDLVNYQHRNFRVHDISEWDLLNIMYTSGTTDKPKGAMHFHRGMIATAMLTREFMNYQHGRDRHLCVVPLFHVTGLAMNLIAPVLSGAPVIFMNKLHTEDALQLIQKERITTTVSVITVYWLMLNHKNFDQYNLSSLREILYGGSPAAEGVIKQMKEKLPGVLIHNGYGLTETHAYDTHLMDKDSLSHIQSVGQILPLVAMRVVDSEGRDVPMGEAGELLIKGCKVIRGYWNKPEANKNSFTNGWFHTGDIARIDRDGYVYIVDRLKDMINRGGEKIFSIEVENVLYSHSKILEAAVFGTPDEVFGEQVKAAVVMKPGQSLSEEEVRSFCAKKLADYKVPKGVVFLEELPRNPAGKVVKGQLRQAF